MTGPGAPRRGRRSVWLRRGLPVLVALLLAGALLVLNLGGDADPRDSGTPQASTADEGSGGPADPGSEPTPTEPPSPITLAQAAPVVVREGVPESSRTIEATRAEFTAPAEWSDGASVRVVEVRQQVTDGKGPGDMVGQPQTVFTLELTNGTDAPLDLNSVVVQATYGSAPTQAGPLYDGNTVDFAGTLEPGASATAVYSFAVPEDQLGDVNLSIDVDGHRFPAVFTGAVPVR